jgi:hypothetical protein
MPPPVGRRDNPPAVQAALSPELVLVSPPEVAAEARRALPAPRPLTYRAPERLSHRALAVFYVACVAGTLGPLALAYAAR